MRTINWALAGMSAVAMAGCTELPAGAGSGETTQVATSQQELITITKVVTKGTAIDVGWADALSQGYLLAAGDNTNKVATAFITANQLNFDPTSQVCTTDPVLGTFCHYTRVSFDTLYANINPADIVVSTKTARLNTDLSLATNLTFTRCVYDETAATTTCNNVIPPGTINLTWQRTNADYTKSFGITETKTGPQTVRVTGSRAFYSADTSGSAMGTTLQHKTGSMGTSNTITIDILNTP